MQLITLQETESVQNHFTPHSYIRSLNLELSIMHMSNFAAHAMQNMIMMAR